MNILQIASKIPYPLNDGGSIDTFNILKFLSLRGHNITFLSFINDNSSYEQFKKYCQLFSIKKNTKNNLIGIVKNIFSNIPYTIEKYYSREMLNLIDELFKTNNFDLVYIDHLHLAYCGKYIKSKYRIPIILREQNFETQIWKRLYNEEKNYLKKMFFLNQYFKIKKYEPLMCEVFDSCLMVTNKDKEELLKFSVKIKAEVIPAGVNIEYFDEKYTGKTEKHSILFIGSLDWYPNVDSFKWFYEKIFFQLVKIYPELTVYVVGKNPPNWIKNLKVKNLKVCGMVDDVREYFDKSEICVVPLKIGGGMRIKILEMLAMKKPVVTTSIGCEGIEVKNNYHLLIADNEKEFIISISRLFDDALLRDKCSSNGYALVKETYKWEKIAEKIEEINSNLLKNNIF